MHKDLREDQDYKAQLEYLVPEGQWGTKVVLEIPVCLGLKGKWGHEDRRERREIQDQ